MTHRREAEQDLRRLPVAFVGDDERIDEDAIARLQVYTPSPTVRTTPTPLLPGVKGNGGVAYPSSPRSTFAR
jgi:hypothetical protein